MFEAEATERARKELADREVEDLEAYQVLLARAEREGDGLPPEILARHVIGVTKGGDWPVRREAMEAVVRRLAKVRDEGLRVAATPEGGQPLGAYATRRAREAANPYITSLWAVDPIRGSCDCRDFLRNSLGLCKHLLTVLQELAARPRKWQRALREQQQPASARGLSLRWYPVRPLTGAGDWLERVRLRVGHGGGPPAGQRRWFKRGGEGEFVLRSTLADRPGGRLDLVRGLEALNRGRGARQDPALRALLRAERLRLQASLGGDHGTRGWRRHMRSLKRQLYPYQTEGVARMLEAGCLLLADDMGLGKTAQAIAACHVLYRMERVKRGLLIVPASLKFQWEREWSLFSETPVAVVEGGPEARQAIYRRQRRGFLIANYEQVLRDLDVMQAWKPDIGILDEAQRIKNWATKTAMCVKRLEPRYRIVLTGTPLENRLGELASIMDWVDDFALEPKWRLQPWHAKTADGSRDVIGARNLDTLRQRLSRRMKRRLRSEVLDQLPSRTDTQVPVEMTAAQRSEHDELNLPIRQLIAIARRRPLTQKQFLRLMMLLTTQRIIANGLAQFQFPEVWPSIRERRPTEALLRSLSSPKLEELREILLQVAVEQGRKVVVFSHWRRMLKLAHWAMGDVLAAHGLRAAFFTGAESQKRRTRNVVDFHDEPEVRVLLATDAGGVGLNLQRAASCCVNLELPWNPAVLEQRIGRIYRLGQKRPIDVYNLVAAPSIEARIATLVSDKQALFSGLFDGDQDQIRFERSGSFIESVVKVVDPEALADKEDATRDDEDRDCDELPDAELEARLEAADEAEDAQSDSSQEAGASVAADARRVSDPPNLPLSAGDVTGLFSSLDITPREDGGMTIDAPPEAAATLASLFEGMARLLRAGP